LNLRIKIIIIPATLLVFLCNAQKPVKQTGAVSSAGNEAVSSATIIAKGINSDDFKFASANLDGNYSLQLTAQINYEITVRSIGYVTVTDTVTLLKDRIKNYVLEKSNESLDSILIKARAPMVQMGDTTAYRVEYFLTGNERKAGDILEKIPGVEVDARGNVQVDGKDVTVLMVDGKVFFSGDEKLGVNNIPSDVIDEIEIIHNYDPIPFMKNLKESEQIALNIKLKDNKRNFFFGEVGAAAGYQDIYNAHANLFYYSKNLGFNLISGTSNDGERVFTLQDYIDFEGGSSLILNDPKAYFALQNSSFGAYLNRDDFVENRNIVGAFNIVHEASARNTLSAYSVWLDDTSAFSSRAVRNYPQQGLDELLENNDAVNALLGLTKLKWQYRKTSQNYWDITGLLRTAFSNSSAQLQSTVSNGDDRFTNSASDLTNYTLEFKVLHNAQWSDNSFVKWETAVKSSVNDDASVFNFNEPVFNNLLPFAGDPTNLNIGQKRESTSTSVESALDYFWNYSRRSHLNPKLSIAHTKDNFISLDEELLSNGSINSFLNDGFNNNLNFELTTAGAGLEHAYKNDYHNLRMGFMVNWYNYNTNNINTQSNNVTTLRFLPVIDYSLTLLGNKKINLDYRTSVNLPNSFALANRFRLAGYNRVIRGAVNLDEQYIHNTRLYYSAGTRSLGYLFNSAVHFNYSAGAIQASRTFDNIDQITQYIFLREPNSNIGFNATYYHLMRNWRVGLSPNYRVSASRDLINDAVVDLNVVTYGYRINAVSSYKYFVNVTAAINQRYNNYDGFNTNKFVNTSLEINLSHDFSDSWVLSTDFSQTYFKNRTTGDTRQFGLFDIAGQYKPAKSAWIFDLDVRNIYNVKARSDSSISDFIISQTDTFILPFRATLGVSYTL